MAGGGATARRAAQTRVLLAFAAAVWPSEPPPEGASEAEARFWTLSGADVPEAAEGALEIIDKRLLGINRAALLIVLQLLAWPLTTLLIAGRACLSPAFPWLPRALPDMAPREVQGLLLAWRHSWVIPLRGAFKALKSVIIASLFAAVDSRGNNPFFEAVEYFGASPPPWEPAPAPGARAGEEVLATAVVDLAAALAAAGAGGLAAYLARRGLRAGAGEGGGGARPGTRRGERPPAAVIDADAVVVGSGAGGGVAAAQLAAAGLRVVVVEKGSWKRMQDLTLLEGESTRTMFERGAFLTTEDGGMSILAGATMGGGTKINWCASLRTPDHVRREWAERHGLPRFLAPEYDAAMDAVGARLGVQETTKMNGHNGALFEGLKALGAGAGRLPRNCASDECSGYCSLGCKSGHKASTDASYLVDAARRGARVLTNARARRVLLTPNAGKLPASPLEAPPATGGGGGAAGRSSRAVGVELSVGGDDDDFGSGERVVVRAPLVIASAGSIHNPALLLRSGVTCRGNVGAHLRLHPAFGAMGLFDRPSPHLPPGAPDTCGNVSMHKGAMMLTYSLDAAHWEQGGYGAMVSVPSLHPGLLAACHPWDPDHYKTQLRRMQDIATSVVFARDCGSGRVKIDAQGRPRVSYWPTAKTREHVLQGMELALRALFAAGAESVLLPHSFGHLVARREGGVAGLDAMLAAARRGGVSLYDMPLLSAHQMGSCRMGSSPRDSVCDGDGQVWGVAGLYVADASAFPTASGVNPMITAMSIAHMVSAGIAGRVAAARKAAAPHPQAQAPPRARVVIDAAGCGASEAASTPGASRRASSACAQSSPCASSNGGKDELSE